MRITGFIRKVAAVTVICFSVTSVAGPSSGYSQIPQSPVQVKALSSGEDFFDSLKIAQSIGKIKALHRGSQNGIVIHIQDAHVQEEAQRNIAAILEYFIKQKKLGIVGLEGASGKLYPEAFSFFPSREARKKAADYFLREGRLSGAEYLSLVEKPNIELYGIEDSRLYEENRQAFIRTLKVKPATEEVAAKLSRLAHSLTNHAYDPSMKELYRERKKFKESNGSLFLPYLRFLGDRAEKNGVSIEDFPVLGRFLEILNRETKKDLSENDYSELYKIIDVGLFDQLESLEKTLKEKFLHSKEARSLDRLTLLLETYDKFFDFSMTVDDARFYFSARDEFKSSHLRRLIKPLLEKYHFEEQALEELELLDQGARNVERFYELALARDTVLIENTLRRMKEKNEKSAAIITGGFHTPGIEHYLKDRGYSYVVVTPKISKEFDSAKNKERYESALHGRPEYIEKAVREVLSQKGNSSGLNDPRFQLAVRSSLPNPSRMEEFSAKGSVEILDQAPILALTAFHSMEEGFSLRPTAELPPAVAPFAKKVSAYFDGARVEGNPDGTRVSIVTPDFSMHAASPDALRSEVRDLSSSRAVLPDGRNFWIVKRSEVRETGVGANAGEIISAFEATVQDLLKRFEGEIPEFSSTEFPVQLFERYREFNVAANRAITTLKSQELVSPAGQKETLKNRLSAAYQKLQTLREKLRSKLAEQAGHFLDFIEREDQNRTPRQVFTNTGNLATARPYLNALAKASQISSSVSTGRLASIDQFFNQRLLKFSRAAKKKKQEANASLTRFEELQTQAQSGTIQTPADLAKWAQDLAGILTILKSPNFLKELNGITAFEKSLLKLGNLIPSEIAAAAAENEAASLVARLSQITEGLEQRLVPLISAMYEKQISNLEQQMTALFGNPDRDPEHLQRLEFLQTELIEALVKIEPLLVIRSELRQGDKPFTRLKGALEGLQRSAGRNAMLRKISDLETRVNEFFAEVEKIIQSFNQGEVDFDALTEQIAAHIKSLDGLKAGYDALDTELNKLAKTSGVDRGGDEELSKKWGGLTKLLSAEDIVVERINRLASTLMGMSTQVEPSEVPLGPAVVTPGPATPTPSLAPTPELTKPAAASAVSEVSSKTQRGAKEILFQGFRLLAKSLESVGWLLDRIFGVFRYLADLTSAQAQQFIKVRFWLGRSAQGHLFKSAENIVPPIGAGFYSDNPENRAVFADLIRKRFLGTDQAGARDEEVLVVFLKRLFRAADGDEKQRLEDFTVSQLRAVEEALSLENISQDQAYREKMGSPTWTRQFLAKKNLTWLEPAFGVIFGAGMAVLAVAYVAWLPVIFGGAYIALGSAIWVGALIVGALMFQEMGKILLVEFENGGALWVKSKPLAMMAIPFFLLLPFHVFIKLMFSFIQPLIYPFVYQANATYRRTYFVTFAPEGTVSVDLKLIQTALEKQIYVAPPLNPELNDAAQFIQDLIKQGLDWATLNERVILKYGAAAVILLDQITAASKRTWMDEGNWKGAALIPDNAGFWQRFGIGIYSFLTSPTNLVGGFLNWFAKRGRLFFLGFLAGAPMFFGVSGTVIAMASLVAYAGYSLYMESLENQQGQSPSVKLKTIVLVVMLVVIAGLWASPWLFPGFFSWVPFDFLEWSVAKFDLFGHPVEFTAGSLLRNLFLGGLMTFAGLYVKAKNLYLAEEYYQKELDQMLEKLKGKLNTDEENALKQLFVQTKDRQKAGSVQYEKVVELLERIANLPRNSNDREALLSMLEVLRQNVTANLGGYGVAEQKRLLELIQKTRADFYTNLSSESLAGEYKKIIEPGGEPVRTVVDRKSEILGGWFNLGGEAGRRARHRVVVSWELYTGALTLGLGLTLLTLEIIGALELFKQLGGGHEEGNWVYTVAQFIEVTLLGLFQNVWHAFWSTLAGQPWSPDIWIQQKLAENISPDRSLADARLKQIEEEREALQRETRRDQILREARDKQAKSEIKELLPVPPPPKQGPQPTPLTVLPIETPSAPQKIERLHEEPREKIDEKKVEPRVLQPPIAETINEPPVEIPSPLVVEPIKEAPLQKVEALKEAPLQKVERLQVAPLDKLQELAKEQIAILERVKGIRWVPEMEDEKTMKLDASGAPVVVRTEFIRQSGGRTEIDFFQGKHETKPQMPHQTRLIYPDRIVEWERDARGKTLYTRLETTDPKTKMARYAVYSGEWEQTPKDKLPLTVVFAREGKEYLRVEQADGVSGPIYNLKFSEVSADGKQVTIRSYASIKLESFEKAPARPAGQAYGEKVFEVQETVSRILLESTFDKTGKLTGRKNYDYNEKGRLTRTQTSFLSDGKRETVGVTYYDPETGLEKAVFEKQADGKFMGRFWTVIKTGADRVENKIRTYANLPGVFGAEIPEPPALLAPVLETVEIKEKDQLIERSVKDPKTGQVVNKEKFSSDSASGYQTREVYVPVPPATDSPSVSRPLVLGDQDKDQFTPRPLLLARIEKTIQTPTGAVVVYEEDRDLNEQTTHVVYRNDRGRPVVDLQRQADGSYTGQFWSLNEEVRQQTETILTYEGMRFDRVPVMLPKQPAGLADFQEVLVRDGREIKEITRSFPKTQRVAERLEIQIDPANGDRVQKLYKAPPQEKDKPAKAPVLVRTERWRSGVEKPVYEEDRRFDGAILNAVYRDAGGHELVQLTREDKGDAFSGKFLSIKKEGNRTIETVSFYGGMKLPDLSASSTVREPENEKPVRADITILEGGTVKEMKVMAPRAAEKDQIERRVLIEKDPQTQIETRLFYDRPSSPLTSRQPGAGALVSTDVVPELVLTRTQKWQPGAAPADSPVMIYEKDHRTGMVVYRDQKGERAVLIPEENIEGKPTGKYSLRLFKVTGNQMEISTYEGLAKPEDDKEPAAPENQKPAVIERFIRQNGQWVPADGLFDRLPGVSGQETRELPADSGSVRAKLLELKANRDLLLKEAHKSAQKAEEARKRGDRSAEAEALTIQKDFEKEAAKTLEEMAGLLAPYAREKKIEMREVVSWLEGWKSSGQSSRDFAPKMDVPLPRVPERIGEAPAEVQVAGTSRELAGDTFSNLTLDRISELLSVSSSRSMRAIISRPPEAGVRNFESGNFPPVPEELARKVRSERATPQEIRQYDDLKDRQREYSAEFEKIKDPLQKWMQAYGQNTDSKNDFEAFDWYVRFFKPYFVRDSKAGDEAGRLILGLNERMDSVMDFLTSLNVQEEKELPHYLWRVLAPTMTLKEWEAHEANWARVREAKWPGSKVTLRTVLSLALIELHDPDYLAKRAAVEQSVNQGASRQSEESKFKAWVRSHFEGNKALMAESAQKEFETILADLREGIKSFQEQVQKKEKGLESLRRQLEAEKQKPRAQRGPLIIQGDSVQRPFEKPNPEIARLETAIQEDEKALLKIKEDLRKQQAGLWVNASAKLKELVPILAQGSMTRQDFEAKIKDLELDFGIEGKERRVSELQKKIEQKRSEPKRTLTITQGSGTNTYNQESPELKEMEASLQLAQTDLEKAKEMGKEHRKAIDSLRLAWLPRTEEEFKALVRSYLVDYEAEQNLLHQKELERIRVLKAKVSGLEQELEAVNKQIAQKAKLAGLIPKDSKEEYFWLTRDALEKAGIPESTPGISLGLKPNSGGLVLPFIGNPAEVLRQHESALQKAKDLREQIKNSKDQIEKIPETALLETELKSRIEVLKAKRQAMRVFMSPLRELIASDMAAKRLTTQHGLEAYRHLDELTWHPVLGRGGSVFRSIDQIRQEAALERELEILLKKENKTPDEIKALEEKLKIARALPPRTDQEKMAEWVNIQRFIFGEQTTAFLATLTGASQDKMLQELSLPGKFEGAPSDFVYGGFYAGQHRTAPAFVEALKGLVKSDWPRAIDFSPQAARPGEQAILRMDRDWLMFYFPQDLAQMRLAASYFQPTPGHLTTSADGQKGGLSPRLDPLREFLWKDPAEYGAFIREDKNIPEEIKQLWAEVNPYYGTYEEKYLRVYENEMARWLEWRSGFPRLTPQHSRSQSNLGMSADRTTMSLATGRAMNMSNAGPLGIQLGGGLTVSGESGTAMGRDFMSMSSKLNRMDTIYEDPWSDAPAAPPAIPYGPGWRSMFDRVKTNWALGFDEWTRYSQRYPAYVDQPYFQMVENHNRWAKHFRGASEGWSRTWTNQNFNSGADMGSVFDRLNRNNSWGANRQDSRSAASRKTFEAGYENINENTTGSRRSHFDAFPAPPAYLDVLPHLPYLRGYIEGASDPYHSIVVAEWKKRLAYYPRTIQDTFSEQTTLSGMRHIYEEGLEKKQSKIFPGGEGRGLGWNFSSSSSEDFYQRVHHDILRGSGSADGSTSSYLSPWLARPANPIFFLSSPGFSAWDLGSGYWNLPQFSPGTGMEAARFIYNPVRGEYYDVKEQKYLKPVKKQLPAKDSPMPGGERKTGALPTDRLLVYNPLTGEETVSDFPTGIEGLLAQADFPKPADRSPNEIAILSYFKETPFRQWMPKPVILTPNGPVEAKRVEVQIRVNGRLAETQYTWVPASEYKGPVQVIERNAYRAYQDFLSRFDPSAALDQKIQEQIRSLTDGDIQSRVIAEDLMNFIMGHDVFSRNGGFARSPDEVFDLAQIKKYMAQHKAIWDQKVIQRLYMPEYGSLIPFLEKVIDGSIHREIQVSGLAGIDPTQADSARNLDRYAQDLLRLDPSTGQPAFARLPRDIQLSLNLPLTLYDKQFRLVQELKTIYARQLESGATDAGARKARVEELKKEIGQWKAEMKALGQATPAGEAQADYQEVFKLLEQIEKMESWAGHEYATTEQARKLRDAIKVSEHTLNFYRGWVYREMLKTVKPFYLYAASLEILNGWEDGLVEKDDIGGYLEIKAGLRKAAGEFFYGAGKDLNLNDEDDNGRLTRMALDLYQAAKKSGETGDLNAVIRDYKLLLAKASHPKIQEETRLILEKLTGQKISKEEFQENLLSRDPEVAGFYTSFILMWAKERVNEETFKGWKAVIENPEIMKEMNGQLVQFWEAYTRALNSSLPEGRKVPLPSFDKKFLDWDQKTRGRYIAFLSDVVKKVVENDGDATAGWESKKESIAKMTAFFNQKEKEGGLKPLFETVVSLYNTMTGNEQLWGKGLALDDPDKEPYHLGALFGWIESSLQNSEDPNYPETMAKKLTVIFEDATRKKQIVELVLQSRAIFNPDPAQRKLLDPKQLEKKTEEFLRKMETGGLSEDDLGELSGLGQDAAQKAVNEPPAPGQPPVLNSATWKQWVEIKKRVLQQLERRDLPATQSRSELRSSQVERVIEAIESTGELAGRGPIILAREAWLTQFPGQTAADFDELFRVEAQKQLSAISASLSATTGASGFVLVDLDLYKGDAQALLLKTIIDNTSSNTEIALFGSNEEEVIGLRRQYSGYSYVKVNLKTGLPKYMSDKQISRDSVTQMINASLVNKEDIRLLVEFAQLSQQTVVMLGFDSEYKATTRHDLKRIVQTILTSIQAKRLSEISA